ncbi:MAG: right-handed parallel beta-helix repeat-containing protein [Thermoanaerobaculia bacterium]
MIRKVFLSFVAASLTFAGAASAQASRTWVSGVGDDANPCSRTAPCKTFAGAISKTAAQGEISVLDSGGFGAVTITKSISIVAEGAEGSILAAGTNGVIINAGPNDNITLHGLTISGFNTGINGIRFLAGASLHVEDCTIERFNQFGISFEPVGSSQLSVKNTVVRNLLGATGGGVLLRPGALGLASAVFDGLTAVRNHTGVQIEDRGRATMRNSTIASNTAFGLLVKTASAAAEANVSSSQVSNNVAAGLKAEGAVATVRLNDTTVTSNGTGLVSATGGAVLSFGSNRISGNTTNGAPTGVLGQQ